MGVKSLKTSGVVGYKKSNSMLASSSFQDFELIESVFVAAPAASVTFSNLQNYANDYKHLQLRYVARDTNTSLTLRNTVMTFNSDTTSYYSHSISGNGAAVGSGGIATSVQGYPGVYYSGTDTNIFGAGIIDILDPYNTSKNTTVRSLNGIGVSNGGIVLASFVYIDTQAIGSITIFSTGTSFAAGSRFSLYGIR
jgi:hypothetical protein